MPVTVISPAEADGLPMITLWQPFASLIFCGAKRHETRSWAYPDKLEAKPIVIHAAVIKVKDEWVSPELDALCTRHFGVYWRDTLPRGAALGVAKLGGAFPAERVITFADDRTSGDWTPGRFVWRLNQIKAFAEPVPYRGKQGWGCFELDKAA